MKGIYPECTFNMSRNISAPTTSSITVTGSKQLIVLGCNIFYNIGQSVDYYINYNHVAVCPVGHFGASYMNENDITSGGYYNSYMNQSIIGLPTTTGNIAGTINEQLYAEFGSHLKTTQEYLSKSISTTITNRKGDDTDLGGSASSQWYTTQAVLMSESEVFGTTIFNSSGHDIGSAKRHLPTFYYDSKAMNRRDNSFWLRDIASKICFCLSHKEGNATYNRASNVSNTIGHIRPRFVLA